MIFCDTSLRGAYVIEPERLDDERGFFARTWDARAFADRGLNTALAECSISFNRQRGTLRGMHFQRAPHEEAKVVRCTLGAIYDVIIDLRPASATFRRWIGEELTAENRRMLYIPEGFAHGFQTLEDDSEVLYQISTPYVPDHGAGVRWNDPAFGIRWPEVPERIMSDRDRLYPDFVA